MFGPRGLYFVVVYIYIFGLCMCNLYLMCLEPYKHQGDCPICYFQMGHALAKKVPDACHMMNVPTYRVDTVPQ